MTIAIIQARMGSTRLPGKVLREINGIPMLKHQIDRVEKSKDLDDIVVATSTLSKDDPIAEFCSKNDIRSFRGSEDDVLDRYYRCAKEYSADIIVRLTGDCPLLDPVLIDRTIVLLKESKADFAANTVPPDSSKYPNGSDVEVFSMSALERAHKECADPHDREHVTFYFWKYDNGFRTAQLQGRKDLSQYRITVDYPEDLEVVEYIFKEIERRGIFGNLEDIIEIIDARPEMRMKNSHYDFTAGWKR